MFVPATITADNGAISITCSIHFEGFVCSPILTPKGIMLEHPQTTQPLVELRLDGIGNWAGTCKSAKGLIGGLLSRRLRYASHRIEKDGNNIVLVIEQTSDWPRISVVSTLSLVGSLPIIRSWTSITNRSNASIQLVYLSSFVTGSISPRPPSLDEPRTWDTDYTLRYATNSWFREAQWQEHTLHSLGLSDVGLSLFPSISSNDSMAFHTVANRSTFSTTGHLPIGMLYSDRERRDDLVLWQVENNGAWRWDVGDQDGGLYVATSGPEAGSHDWRLTLEEGEEYTTPITAVYRGKGDIDSAFSALNKYRQTIIRPHPDYDTLPIIFNDYMNCLMGDPTDEKIMALLDPVAASGAEYFVIDAGWYADDGDWWDDVGKWEPSVKRFPMGFVQLLDKIREKGLKPGVWIEPEVIGVRCNVADELPSEAFMQRGGKRILERGRYHLDFRHPAAVSHVDRIIEPCIVEWGVKYFKFDYNIEHVLGTDIDCTSPGVGQAGHSRAYLAWVNSILSRYPDIVIENCSSGGQRMEYGMLSIHTLQSTSDQQDPALYAPIAASLPTAVHPIQSATWAYPQREWSDEINALTVANSLLGRVHLSGRLDHLSERQLKDIVYEGMKVYQLIKMDLRDAEPFWPLGLPRWDSRWLALGMSVGEGKAYVMVWKRRAERDRIVLPMRRIKKGAQVQIRLLYPASFQAEARWDGEGGLEVRLEAEVCARLFQLDF